MRTVELKIKIVPDWYIFDLKPFMIFFYFDRSVNPYTYLVENLKREISDADNQGKTIKKITAVEF